MFHELEHYKVNSLCQFWYTVGFSSILLLNAARSPLKELTQEREELKKYQLQETETKWNKTKPNWLFVTVKYEDFFHFPFKLQKKINFKKKKKKIKDIIKNYNSQFFKSAPVGAITIIGNVNQTESEISITNV